MVRSLGLSLMLLLACVLAWLAHGALSPPTVNFHTTLGAHLANPSDGYSPQDLWRAYHLPGMTAKTHGTVAVVIPYHSPTAASDLATYRSQFGLPPCTTASRCFRQIDQRGGRRLPAANDDAALEENLDIEMVSATCPTCRIIVVEADSFYYKDLVQAEHQAASLHPAAISNSWTIGTDDQAFGLRPCKGVADWYTHPNCVPADRWQAIGPHDFRAPGIAVLFASGDEGYGAEYPATSPDVVAVGGTTLTDTFGIGQTETWSETAWERGGSGCSFYFAKPPWQNDRACKGRSVADVSFVADPATGVAMYSSQPYHGYDVGWVSMGGTSVGAPAIAGLYGLVDNARFMASPSRFLYAHATLLHDVASGTNVPTALVWSPERYLAQAGPGYDGPTGNGSPFGVGAF